jgi:xanthine dehydrogenase molybdenum-binding subunit
MSCTALWRGEDLFIWDAQQSVFQARSIIALVLGISEQRVHVYSEYIGGGFGGKCLDHTDNALYQLYAAFLAKETGRPVRFEFTLSEELGAYESRHPFTFNTKWGVNRDGKILAQQWKVVADTGGYGSSGAPVAMLAGDHIAHAYRSDSHDIQAFAVFTTNLVGGEFRGFGGLQGMYAVERHIDTVAHELGMNPLDLRLLNARRTGDEVGGVTYGVVDVQGTVEKAAKRFDWDRWTPPDAKTGVVRRGLGMSQGPMPSGRAAADGLVWIDREGKVHVRFGVGNLGNAAHTGIAIVVEEVLGVPIEDQYVTWANTDRDAWTFCTDASRSCHCDGKAAFNAAQDCVRQLLALGEQHFSIAADQLEVKDGAVHRRDGTGAVDFQTLARMAGKRMDYTPYWEPADKSPLLDEQTGNLDEDPEMVVEASTETAARQLIDESGGIVGLGRYVFNPHTKAWGSCFAEVEVDMRTGRVKIVQLVIAHEIGRLLFPRGAEAQIHGGALQGMGFAMTEDLVLDPHSSVPVNASYYEYRPPTSLDYPEIVSLLLEAPAKAGPFGAKGLGESPIFGPPPAIGNAIFNAIGVMIPDLPFTPDKVYDALKNAGKLVL